MTTIKISGISRFVILAALLVLPSSAAADVDCDHDRAGSGRGGPGPLQRAINRSRPGDTIHVRGTCQENVTIGLGKDLITLDGGGAAAITGPDPTQPTVLVRSKDTTIKGFTITGGLGGIAVSQGGIGRIDGNTIRDSGGYGVIVSQLSTAVIVNNTIQNNFQAGVGVAETSYAFIGFVTSTDTVASPNVITGNRAQGVVGVPWRLRSNRGKRYQPERSQRGEREGVVLRADLRQHCERQRRRTGSLSLRARCASWHGHRQHDLHATQHDDDQQCGVWNSVSGCSPCRRSAR